VKQNANVTEVRELEVAARFGRDVVSVETYLRFRLGLVSDKFANISVSILKVPVLVSAVSVSQIRPRFWHVIVVGWLGV
jgi:hypothetical protein